MDIIYSNKILAIETQQSRVYVFICQSLKCISMQLARC